MFRVLIADDEELVCELILRSIDWKQLGMTVIGVVYDGLEALEVVKKEIPELIITDVRMPGIDGINLIQRVKDLNLDCRFVIISGHQDFEYVHSAFKFGAVDYVLKPIDEVDFTKTLLKIKQDYYQSNEDLRASKVLKKQVEASKLILQKQFFYDYVINKNPNDYCLDEINKKYSLNFRDGHFIILNIIFESYDSEVDKNMETLDLILDLKFKNVCHTYYYINHDNNLIIILNYNEEVTFGYLLVVLNQLIKLIEEKSYILYHNIAIGIGNYVKDINLLNDSYRHANAIKHFRKINKIEKINDYSKYEISNTNNEVISLPQQKQLIYMIELSDYSAIVSWIKKAFKDLAMQDIEPSQIYSLANNIKDFFFMQMTQNKKNFPEVFPKSGISIPTISDFQKCNSLDDLTQSLCKFISDCFSLYDCDLQKERKAIETAKNYIAENYTQQIHLEDVANLVYLNPTYFSVFFKNQTGMNFSDYLIHFRIKRSLDLLKDLKLSIAQISEMVGYKNEKYFSRLFKKIVGINPAEYRKLHV